MPEAGSDTSRRLPRAPDSMCFIMYGEAIKLRSLDVVSQSLDLISITCFSACYRTRGLNRHKLDFLALEPSV